MMCWHRCDFVLVLFLVLTLSVDMSARRFYIRPSQLPNPQFRNRPSVAMGLSIGVGWGRVGGR